MGNLIQNKVVEEYNDIYTTLDNNTKNKIREQYKVIDVDWLDPIIINSTIFGDEYFTKLPKKKEIINIMLDYYLNHKDRGIYKKTDYLCNKKEKICICNTHAEDFRKIYERNNYEEGKKYISWCKKIKEPF
jgi:hypothetical protein